MSIMQAIAVRMTRKIKQGALEMSQGMICYSRSYSADDLEKDVAVHGRSTIMEKIICESKAGKGYFSGLQSL